MQCRKRTNWDRDGQAASGPTTVLFCECRSSLNPLVARDRSRKGEKERPSDGGDGEEQGQNTLAPALFAIEPAIEIFLWMRAGDRAGTLPPPLTPRVLDLVKVNCAGLAFAIAAKFIRQALLGLRGIGAIPLDGAIFEAQNIAAGFRLDRAEALGLVERLDDSK